MNAKATDTDVFDKRVVNRLIKNGIISQEDYDKHLKSLPDLKDECVPVEARIEHVEVKVD